MDVLEERVSGVLVLAPDGRLDVAGAADLQLAAIRLVEAGERRVVVDLARASEVSGAALRVLLMLGKRLAGLGGALAVCGMAEEARRALEVAGLGEAIQVASTRTEALAGVSSAGSEKQRVEKVTELAARLLGAAPTADKKKATKAGGS